MELFEEFPEEVVVLEEFPEGLFGAVLEEEVEELLAAQGSVTRTVFTSLGVHKSPLQRRMRYE